MSMERNIQMKIRNGATWDTLFPKTKAELVDGLSTQLATKQDAESGKGLSANDYTTVEKNKLAGIATGANNYVHPTGNGNNHIPLNGSVGQFLRNSSAGVAGWHTLTANDIPMLSLAKISDSGTVAGLNTGTAQGNVPVLGAGGKLDTSVLPALAITDTFVVASQVAMLGLTNAETGDIAVRTDISKTFILKQLPASTLANWEELLSPGAPVQSVAGKTGAVTLTSADVGLGNVNNTSDVNKPVSTAQQNALNLKADKTELHAHTNKAILDATTASYTTAEENKLAGIATNANNYVHPANHPASIITQDINNRFVTDAEKVAWNAKSNLTLGTTSATAYRGDLGNIAYTHSQSTHAPTNAQKNSDITKAEIEAKLTGNVRTHQHYAVQATAPVDVDMWYEII